MEIATLFSKTLLDWFEENQRYLPWRGETDPYKIWISEIILQQTRVNQGWDYYLKFIARFPNVKSLAEAPLQEVLHVWQGLGYYSRARNMQNAAQQIMQEHNGVFPHDYFEIIKLKGIGAYTAAAISSIAFQLPYSAVDGNVLRVISRIFGIYEDIAQQKTVRNITELCQRIMDKEFPGNFNQALMEFGAIHCTPKNPKCEKCPFTTQCVAFEKEQQELLPIKSSKVKIKNRYFHYFIFIKDNKTIIEQRTAKDIWKNLYQFPMIETAVHCDTITNTQCIEYLQINNIRPVFLKEVKHKLTHQHLTIRFYIVNDYFPDYINKKLETLFITSLMVPVKDLGKYPFPAVLKEVTKSF